MAYQNSNFDVRGAIINEVGRDLVAIDHLYQLNNPAISDLSGLLAPVDAAYNRGGPVTRCLPGTREKLIAEIVRWFEQDNDRVICWANGPAGSGKSAISQTIAEWCNANNRLAASFFFFRGAGSRSKITHFIPSLAYQLSISVPSTKPIIQRVLQSDPLIYQRSLRHQFEKLMVEPILTAARNSTFEPMAIVIDALDECDDKAFMAEFIEIVIDAFRQDRPIPLRVFFTSRIEEHLRKKLESPAARLTIYPLSLQDFDARVDIHRFFRSRFSTIYEENRRVMGNVSIPWPSESDVDSLTKKAGGLFIFAVTLIDFILKGSGLPQDKLQKALIVDAGLDTLYAQVLSDAPHDHNFKRVIGTIALLNYPLSITLLGHLLRLRAEDIVQTVLGAQSILVIPEDNDQPIRLCHTSLRDFLVARSRSGKFYIDPPARHLIIATDCLTAIAVRPEAGIVWRGVQRYACVNWYYHIHRGLLEGGDNLLHSLTKFPLISWLKNFASQFLDFWVNTLILEGWKDTFDVLNSLLSILKQLPNNSRGLVRVLEDIETRAKV